MALEKGVSNWLNAYPLREYGFDLNKQQFWDGISIWYGWPLSNLPTTCACGLKYDFQHSMNCKKGGLVSIRHNDIRDLIAKHIDRNMQWRWSRSKVNTINWWTTTILISDYRRRSEARYSCSKFLGERSRSIFRYNGF